MLTVTQASRRFHSSELSRNSSNVFAAAEDHPVVVTRRDAESLVLMSEREAMAQKKLLELAALLIAVTLDDRGSLTERMADRFPWMLALSDDDRAQCASDLVRAARASFATDQAHLAVIELAAWKETAVAVAAGLGQEPVEWLDEAETVERP